MIIVLGFEVTLSNSVCKKDSDQAILTAQVKNFLEKRIAFYIYHLAEPTNNRM